MPAPLDPVLRAAILIDIKAGGKSCRGIARAHEVSASTVAKIATDEGIENAFGRAQTKHATEARQADNASRRANLAERLIKLAELSMDQAIAELGEASSRDAAVVIGIAVDKHLALIKADSDNGVSEARSMLGALADGLQAAADALGPEQ